MVALASDAQRFGYPCAKKAAIVMGDRIDPAPKSRLLMPRPVIYGKDMLVSNTGDDSSSQEVKDSELNFGKHRLSRTITW